MSPTNGHSQGAYNDLYMVAWACKDSYDRSMRVGIHAVSPMTGVIN